jgi:hypothetical protein
MIRPSVAAGAAVAAAVYVHGRDTAGSVGSLFCRTAAEDVISTAASTAQAAAADTTRIPGQSGGDLFQDACAAWGGDKVAVEWKASELEGQSGWEEARRGQQQRSSSRQRACAVDVRRNSLSDRQGIYKAQISDPAQGKDVPTSDDVRQSKADLPFRRNGGIVDWMTALGCPSNETVKGTTDAESQTADWRRARTSGRRDRQRGRAAWSRYV